MTPGATIGRPIAVTDADVEEFRSAMDAYKHRSGRMFPTWSEALEVLRSLGYEKRIWRPVVVEEFLAEFDPGGFEDGGTFAWSATVQTAVTAPG